MADTLKSGEKINTGGELKSKNGKYTLKMQADGNLVLYKESKALWASKTDHTDSDYVIMQADGNFVLYDSSNHPHWASNTNKAGSWITLQDDGNLVVYYNPGITAVWATNTQQ